MEKFITATGKTIDLAIAAALEELHMDRDSVSVEVLENPRSGFLGIGAQRQGQDAACGRAALDGPQRRVHQRAAQHRVHGREHGPRAVGGKHGVVVNLVQHARRRVDADAGAGLHLIDVLRRGARNQALVRRARQRRVDEVVVAQLKPSICTSTKRS